MNDFILMKEVEYNANIYFDRIVNLFSKSKNSLDTNLDTSQILKNINSYSDNNMKLLCIIEYKRLIYKYCSNFFNNYSFYDSDFCQLYAFSLVPKLEDFISSNQLNISLNISIFKDYILYSVIENKLGGFFSVTNLNLNATYNEYLGFLDEKEKEKLNSFHNILSAFPDNIDILVDEDKIKILIENKEIYENYKIVKRLIEFYKSQLFHSYIKYKYDLKDSNNIIDIVLNDNEINNLIEIFKEYIERDSLKDFELLLKKKNTNKIYFNTTYANVTFILFSLVENNIIGFSDISDKIYINNNRMKNKWFTNKHYSDFKHKLLNLPNDTNRLDKPLFDKVINNSKLRTYTLSSLDIKIKK